MILINFNENSKQNYIYIATPLKFVFLIVISTLFSLSFFLLLKLYSIQYLKNNYILKNTFEMSL